MNYRLEWDTLKSKLLDSNYSPGYLENCFYKRLLNILNEGSSSELDRLLAYKDALCAAPDGVINELPIKSKIIDDSLLERLHLITRNDDYISLQSDANDHGIALSDIYKLKKRRHINKLSIDPLLKKQLSDENYQYYNGVAQQLSVRLSLLSKNKSTILINLPTGCGKTLVAHALSINTKANKLTLVIVPTIALAVEQGSRVKKLLENINLDHGGKYYWHGQQTKEEHQDIKERIVKCEQLILFCSPEAVCKSLLTTLYSAVNMNYLRNIVIDEAHIIDQWGIGFRPYFQIIISIIRSLREKSRDGIKCLLMSATFTEKNVKLLKELFETEHYESVQIHGCFLRPEIQYHVKRVSINDHQNEVLKSVLYLPKPLIIYALEIKHAEKIHDHLKEQGVTRIGLFTGDTNAYKREILIEAWNEDKLDIMVATSAFGLGMDKQDVRSVLHIAVPENLDRFYQEVGRGGRDGNASQSLIIFHDEQFELAKKLNEQKMITVNLGLEKWKTMWENGKSMIDGSRRINISILHKGLSRTSDSNEEWNWRTLLLMQRSGLIQIISEPAKPPEISPGMSDEKYQQLLENYYDDYYKSVVIMPKHDGHLEIKTWEKIIDGQRSYEILHQKNSLSKLKYWINDYQNQPLCEILKKYYQIENIEPEYACGGCPSCLNDNEHINPPTLGHSVKGIGVYSSTQWLSPFEHNSTHQYVYYKNSNLSNRRLIQAWKPWISDLIEKGVIQAICADQSVLEIVNKILPSGIKRFWIGIPLDEYDVEDTLWSQLILVMPGAKEIPNLGLPDSIKLLIGPDDINDKVHYNNKWWERISNARPFDTFLLGL